MSEHWTKQLPRTAQCKACPWQKDVDPHDIPNGYSAEKHQALASTIADPHNPLAGFGKPLRIMACHEHDSADSVPCVGWLHHQLGDGNNIGLRLAMLDCTNLHKLRLRGEQHATFNDTLPPEVR
jgi:hypothetical protein